MPCSLGPDHIWGSAWIGTHQNVIDVADVAAGPFPVSVLVKLDIFVGTKKIRLVHADNSVVSHLLSNRVAGYFLRSGTLVFLVFERPRICINI